MFSLLLDHVQQVESPSRYIGLLPGGRTSL